MRTRSSRARRNAALIVDPLGALALSGGASELDRAAADVTALAREAGGDSVRIDALAAFLHARAAELRQAATTTAPPTQGDAA